MLRLLGTKQILSWDVLYKILEIIELDLGQRVNKAGLATRKARKRFTMNANHQLLSGDDARHATRRGVPSPKLQMSTGDAKSWLIQVIRAWLEAKK